MEERIQNIAPIAKTWFCVSFIIAIATQFEWINIQDLSFDKQLISRKFQVCFMIYCDAHDAVTCLQHIQQMWRLITTFFYFGKLGIPFAYNVATMTWWTHKLQTEHFAGPFGVTEFVFVILFGAIALLAINCFLEEHWLGLPLSFVMFYVWSRKSADIDLSWWGLPIKAWVLPFVVLLVSFIVDRSTIVGGLGIIVGHLYYFSMDIMPILYQTRLVSCPQILYRIIQNEQDVGYA